MNFRHYDSFAIYLFIIRLLSKIVKDTICLYFAIQFDDLLIRLIPEWKLFMPLFYIGKVGREISLYIQSVTGSVKIEYRLGIYDIFYYVNRYVEKVFHVIVKCLLNEMRMSNVDLYLLFT